VPEKRPNFLFIMTDDHAAHAMSCYGSRINETPHMDRIAEGGMRFDNCFCTNSICTPSRASILTGTHNHVNGVYTLRDQWDNTQPAYQKLLQQAGYQTAIFGKWHLGEGSEHCPTGFDDWSVLPGQGLYHDPEMIDKGPDGGTKRVYKGYATDIITDRCLEWLGRRDPERPFCLMCHHKAPHRPWEPDEKHAKMYEDIDIPVPETFDDDYAGRIAAEAATMRIERDLNETDLKGPVPEGLSPAEQKHWKYQRYIKDYLRCVASVDENIGRMLDWLDENGLAEDTVVVYTSDQGFYLGDHGWYDKRFIYEESLRMPYLMRYPREIAAGSTCEQIVTNVDFAKTFLDLAGVEPDPWMQGRSFRPLTRGETPGDWPQAMYYRYWMHRDVSHNVYAHYGLRTHRYKLVYFYSDPMDMIQPLGEACEPSWELFDLEADPNELRNVYDDPAYADTVRDLKAQLRAIQAEVGDRPHPSETA
jgi:arylsulfatase A-like enzyme